MLIKTVQTKPPLPLTFYHCCQLKSSLDPKTRKKPRMVAKITTLPVSTSAHAPQAICRNINNSVQQMLQNRFRTESAATVY